MTPRISRPARLRLLLLLTGLIPGTGALPLPVAAQSAQGLLEEYLERSERRLSGIQDVLLVQTVMGISTDTWLEREVVAGRSVLRPRLMRVQGQVVAVTEGSEPMADPAAYLAQVVERARVAGREPVDGRATWVLAVDDLSGLSLLPPTPAPDEAEIRPTSMRIFLDPEAWVVRRMELGATVTTPRGESPVTTRVDFGDFRGVEGFLHPFRTVTVLEGLGGALTPEEREQAQRSLAQAEEQMAAMPAEQRRMLEQMLGEQLRQLRETLATGTVTVEVQVLEVQVNRGLPGG